MSYQNGSRNTGYSNGSKRPPPAYSPPQQTLYSGYTPSNQFTNPSGMPVHPIPYSAQSPTGYPPTNRTGVSSRKRPSPPVQCCDQTYAKSKQGIFKIILLILSNIAWICVACTPYIKRIFVIEGKTWPFHLVMFFTTTASIGLLIVYILFVSGYHRRRKRKPWPTYELYFNAWLVVWFLAAALTESCHAWRFNYGPYHARTQPPAGQYTQWDVSYGSNNQGYAHGWDMTNYCRRYPADCHKRRVPKLIP